MNQPAPVWGWIPGRAAWAVAVVVLLLGGAAPAAGQSAPDSSGADSTASSVLVLPNMFYTPETKIAGGLVLGYYTKLDPQSPTSGLQGAAIYTQRRQFYVQILPEFYWQQGRWRLDSELWASRYPNVFYGIGPGVPAAQEEEYTARIADVQAQLQRAVQPGWRIGPEVRVRTEEVTDVADGQLLDTQSIPGRTGATTLGFGLRSTWDGRDNLYYPRQGRFVEVAGMMHAAAAEDWHAFGRLTADARTYVPVAGTHVLAAQGYVEAVAGTAPFPLLPLLGGEDLMRGYREGRYRDRLFAALQAAYRFPLVWRFKAAAFANIGQVAPRLDVFSLGDPKYALGAGLRLRLNDEGVHGRVDYAVSPAGGALYITLLEAF